MKEKMILIASLMVMTEFFTTACRSDNTSRTDSNLKSDANLKYLGLFTEKDIRFYDKDETETSYGNTVTFKLITW